MIKSPGQSFSQGQDDERPPVPALQPNHSVIIKSREDEPERTT
jgi:hypothetical protein